MLQPSFREYSNSIAERDVTRSFWGHLAYPHDTVLARLGDNWEAYRDLRRDGQVHAAFQQRLSAITARELVIEPGRQDALSIAAADQLRRNLRAIGFNRATKLMGWGLFYGFSVAECMWANRDGLLWLDRLKVRTPWRFRFTPEGELRLITRNSRAAGERMPDRKFWVLATGADNDDEPYGLGLAHQLYWPVYFKKQGLAFWLRAIEKFGAPTVVGKYPPGAPQEVIEKLLRACLAIRIDGAVAIPDDCSVELLEANRGTVDQSTFSRQMNAEISKIILGQTMTTDDGASLSQSQVHLDVREAITDADAAELCESFRTGPALWMTRRNFPGAAIPTLRRASGKDVLREASIQKSHAEMIKTMIAAGYEADEATVRKLFPGWRRKALG